MSRRPTMRRRQDGQALLELSLLMPFLILFGVICVQFGVIFSAYMSVVTATRDVARWTSVHPNTTDAAMIAGVNSRLPTNLTPARLTIAVSPACASLTSGKCPARTPGAQLTITLTYDMTDILFLPATVGFGAFQVNVPRTLPPYSMFVQVEPS